MGNIFCNQYIKDVYTFDDLLNCELVTANYSNTRFLEQITNIIINRKYTDEQFIKFEKYSNEHLELLEVANKIRPLLVYYYVLGLISENLDNSDICKVIKVREKYCKILKLANYYYLTNNVWIIDDMANKRLEIFEKKTINKYVDTANLETNLENNTFYKIIKILLDRHMLTHTDNQILRQKLVVITRHNNSSFIAELLKIK